MVLAVKLGRQRPFWRGFLLALGSLGVYGRYWDYRAHDEVFKQFELAREGREQGVPWYFMAYPLPVLKFVYYHHFVANIQHLRMRMGYPRSLSPGAFLAFAIPATASVFVGVLVGTNLIGASLGTEVRPDGDVVPRIEDGNLFAAGIWTLVAGVVLWIGLRAAAYYRLQSDVNGVWDAYDSRAAVLRASLAPPPAPAPWAPAPPAGAGTAGPPRAPPPAAPPGPGPAR